jgi:hypothetical protein
MNSINIKNADGEIIHIRYNLDGNIEIRHSIIGND